jgi:hypothetical protein
MRITWVPANTLPTTNFYWLDAERLGDDLGEDFHFDLATSSKCDFAT